MSSQLTLCDSQREDPSNSISAGEPTSDETIQITLLLRRRTAAPEAHAMEAHPMERHLTRAELAERHGADHNDIHAVEAFASEHHFSIVQTNPAARSIALTGPLSKLAEAFGENLRLTGSLAVPGALKEIVVAVFGFDRRPIASTNHYVHSRAAHSSAYTPRQLAQIYNFPTNTGKNQTIALIELDGGFNSSDLQTYWSQLGLNNVATTAVSVDGAQNAPTGDPNGPDGEVALDIEVAGAIAPAAQIAVYFAPNTDQGFLNAINAAIHDTARKPSVISISWGSPEKEWTPQAMNAYNAAFHDAALLGISVCVASGDNGSSDGEPDGAPHVDFPASSPWVLACGGTRLMAANSTTHSETVWNDGTNGGATGGGFSSHFSRPPYQCRVGAKNATGRGVPDVAAVADPDTGYRVLIDGQDAVIGGTSAVAPLWAGLIALRNEQLGKNIGWFHPQLYGTITRHKALRDILTGTNGAYKAAHGWDCCTGLGTPNGQAILTALKSK